MLVQLVPRTEDLDIGFGYGFLILISIMLLFFTYIFYSRLRNSSKHVTDLKKQVEELENDLKNEDILHDNLIKIKESKGILDKVSELEQLNQDKDKIFSIISHDLVNHIFVLMVETDYLSKNHYKISKEVTADKLYQLNRYSKNLHSVLDNILQWVKGQSNRINLNSDIVEAHSILNQVIEFYEVPAKIKNIKVENNLETTDLVYGDKNLLNTVFRNLLNNAIKFTPKNGNIKFRFSLDKDYDVITITDSGVGMDAKEQIKLFKDDVEFTKQGTEKEKGTGLGMILIKEFIEMHQGKIRVESAPNEGTSFHLHLPKAPFRSRK